MDVDPANGQVITVVSTTSYSAVALHILAEIYQKQEKYTQAEPLYKRALAIHEKDLGEDHPDVAVTLGNLAKCSEEMGKPQEAERYGMRAMQIRSKQK